MGSFDARITTTFQAMFTLYRIVKRSVAESVPDSSVAISAPIKVFRLDSDHLKTYPIWNVPLSTAERSSTVPEQKLFRKQQSWCEQKPYPRCKLITDRASVHTGNASEQFLHHNRTSIPVHTVPEQLLKRSENLSGTV